MNYAEYKVPIPFPDRPKKPHMPINATAFQVRAYADEIEKYEAEMVEFHKARNAWRAEESVLMEKFKVDVLAENGLTGHPKAGRVFSMAWDRGRANGYSGVVYWVEELADLVKE